MERIWGSHRLASQFGKKLPAAAIIGESWEIVDRPEAQSIVRNGPLRGRTLHELWTRDRDAIFGRVADASRFPLLVKLLDAYDTLSLQVHPPEKVAAKLGGEPKTEFWHVAFAIAGAKLLAGLRQAVTRDQSEKPVHRNTLPNPAHTIPVQTRDSLSLPPSRP